MNVLSTFYHIFYIVFMILFSLFFSLRGAAAGGQRGAAHGAPRAAHRAEFVVLRAEQLVGGEKREEKRRKEKGERHLNEM